LPVSTCVPLGKHRKAGLQRAIHTFSSSAWRSALRNEMVIGVSSRPGTLNSKSPESSISQRNSPNSFVTVDQASAVIRERNLHHIQKQVRFRTILGKPVDLDAYRSKPAPLSLAGSHEAKEGSPPGINQQVVSAFSRFYRISFKPKVVGSIATAPTKPQQAKDFPLLNQQFKPESAIDAD
jgi:hypothetical protein